MLRKMKITFMNSKIFNLELTGYILKLFGKQPQIIKLLSASYQTHPQKFWILITVNETLRVLLNLFWRIMLKLINLVRDLTKKISEFTLAITWIRILEDMASITMLTTVIMQHLKRVFFTKSTKVFNSSLLIFQRRKNIMLWKFLQKCQECF